MGAGSQIGTVAGGAIGTFFGVPEVGAALGGAVGGFADPPPLPGSGGGSGFTSASAASYGTTIGNDGWAINFGGEQYASPTKTTTASYPTEPNPLTALQPVQVMPGQADQLGLGMSTQSILLIAVGLLVFVKVLRHK